MGSDLGLIVRTVLSLILDYVRWTQFVPMLMAWGFVLTMLALLALVSFQEASFTLLERVETVLEPHAERLQGMGLLPQMPESGSDGRLVLGTEDFKRLIFGGWAVLGLILFVLSLLRQLLFGARPPRPFAVKMLYLLAAAMLVFAGFSAVYLFGSEPFHGSRLGWFAMFFLAPLVAVVISVYSLGVSAALTALQERLDTGPGGWGGVVQPRRDRNG